MLRRGARAVQRPLQGGSVISLALRFAILAVITLVAVAGVPATAGSLAAVDRSAGDVVGEVRRFWLLLQQGDAASLGPLLAVDFSGTSHEGRVGRTEELAALARLRVAAVAVGSMRAAALGDEAVSVEYSLILNGVLGEADVSGVYYLTDIWLRQSGRWSLWRRSETRAAP